MVYSCSDQENTGFGVFSEENIFSLLQLCDDCLAADTADNDGTGCDNMTVAIVLLSPLSLSLPPSSPSLNPSSS